MLKFPPSGTTSRNIRTSASKLKSPVFGFAASLLALMLVPEIAHAQRAFVAAQGSDANPCSFAAPCRTFQRAHDIITAGGEIDVLDQAGYGPVTITKAVSIYGHGVGGVSVTSGNGITVNAGPNDKVNVRGLVIDGLGFAGNGIRFVSGASLAVQNCMIRSFAISTSFTGNGILFVPTASSKLVVSNSEILENAAEGILVEPSGAGTAKIVLEHVELVNSGNDGLEIVGNASTPIQVALSDSVAANNGGIGVIASGPATDVTVRNTAMANNKGDGLLALAGATIRITRSTITGNLTGVAASSGGIVESLGDNAIRGNTTNGVPTSSVALQ